MLVTTRLRCNVCRRETRHATYPLFGTQECFRCGSVVNVAVPEYQDIWFDSSDFGLPTGEGTPMVMTVGLNGYYWFDWSNSVPYAGIIRTPSA